MPNKKPERLMPKPGPEKHTEIPDSVHTAAQKVARNLLNSPAKSQDQIVKERQGRREREKGATE